MMQKHEEREGTSIKILPSVHKKAKVFAAQNDFDLGELIEVALQVFMEKASEDAEFVHHVKTNWLEAKGGRTIKQ